MDTIRSIEGELLAMTGPPLHRFTAATARAALDARRKSRAPPLCPDVEIDDMRKPELPARTYTPAAPSPDSAIVYCHGGAFVMGQASDFDETCSHLARATQTRVLSVDYRLAPEHPYPAAFDDAMRVIGACEARNIALVGESAGGGLALGCALAERDRGGDRLKALLLLYPLASRVMDEAAPDRDNALLSAADVDWAWRLYLRQDAQDMRYAVPGEVADLAGLPPTLLAHGSSDALSGSVTALADRMRACGSPVEEWLCEGLPHVFTLFRRHAPVQAILDEAAAWLKLRLGARPSHQDGLG